MTDSHEPEKLNQEQSAAEDEEIIELTDRVTEPTESGEPIIELTEIVQAAAPTKTFETSEDVAQNIIELTDVVQKNAGEAVETEDTVLDEMDPFEENMDDVGEEEPANDDDFVDTLGVDLESGIDPPPPPAVSPEMVEEAIERGVKEMLSEKIDTLLRKIIEKEVSKEGERIKRSLKKVDKDVAVLDKRLNNPKFIDKAPPEVVTEAKAQKAALLRQRARLEEALALLDELA